MKQSRKPKTPSIKQIMSDNGYPEGHIVRERCKHTPVPFNTLTEHGGTVPTEKDIVPTDSISPTDPTLIRDTPEWNEAVRNIDSHKTPISHELLMTLTKEEAHHLTQHGQLTLCDLVQRMHGKRCDIPPSPPTLGRIMK
jgi:hypothetical protein